MKRYTLRVALTNAERQARFRERKRDGRAQLIRHIKLNIKVMQAVLQVAQRVDELPTGYAQQTTTAMNAVSAALVALNLTGRRRSGQRRQR